MVRPTAPAPARTPATRDQADAYRFGVRRMEAALARGDTVLLHEQLRSQRRAAFAGVLLALLVLGGVAAHGRFTSATNWRSEKIVVTKSAGTMYAVAQRLDLLVPVANLAAARLVLAALGVEGASGATATPVADRVLAAAPRTAVAAVPGASGVQPEAPGPSGGWAVCDTVTSDATPRLVGTTVVAGVANPVAGAGVAVLAESVGELWAIVDGTRYRVDAGDRAVLDALGTDRRAARPVGAALLASVPTGPDLTVPALPRGDGPPGVDARSGDVVSLGDSRFLVLPTGLREVPPLAGLALAAASGRRIVEVPESVVTALPRLSAPSFGAWPRPPQRWADAATEPVLCRVSAPGETRYPEVVVGATAPVPGDVVTVELAQRDGPGPRADAVVLGAGAGGPVRIGGEAEGTVALVSTTGVLHVIRDRATADALGVGDPADAPGWALRLLPAGPGLDVDAARRVVDVLDRVG
ncbi:type VII secretion protein EccB [Pseudonocardia sp. N23]|uniref:type VII secretion protein EccB n=1 Tax=Pseudonocardia sp. N23 TaxID=1987376 RepID=UPI000BFE45DE|nr:type VII secretion protein EccB [Pseudonocardia sp. N23]GAY10168.1 probable conserved membrane protein [Pseudonocardia sp. N23]